MNMKRRLKVGEASSKIEYPPGSQQLPMTEAVRYRGSSDTRMAEKKVPKLEPITPMRPGSTSGRARSHSMQLRPNSCQPVTSTKMPRSGASR